MQNGQSSRRQTVPAGGRFRTATDHTGYGDLLGLALLALIAFAFRVYRLDYQSLWRDEVDAVIFASRPVAAILSMFTSVGENGPLFFLGLHFWTNLVGTSEFAMRFPSVLFGTLAVLATYRLGAEVAGREVGLIGAILLAVSPYHIWYSQEAKMYALISFLAPLSLILVLRVVDGGRRRLWVAWTVLMAAFLYVHLFATLMGLVAMVWLLLVLPERPRVTRGLVAAVALVVLAALPVARWLIPAALTPAQTGYYPYSLGQMVSILLLNFSMGLRPSPGMWPVVVFVALLVAGAMPLVLHQRTHGWPQPRAVVLLIVYLVVPLLATWLVSLRRPTFTDRYLIISLPGFSLLMAVGITSLGYLLHRSVSRRGATGGVTARGMTARQQIAATRPGQEWAAGNTMTGSGDTTVVRVQPPATLAGRLVQVGLALLIVAVSVPFFWKQTHTPIKADFRGATAYIVERARPDDLLIFVMPYVQRGFTYYHPQLVRTAEPPYTRDMSPAELDQAMRTITAGSTRVWLFLSEAEFWDPGGMITDWFEHNAVRRCGQQFSYIEVRCYDMVR